MARCCVECFADEWLRSNIEDIGEVGDCDYCGSCDVPTVDPSELHEWFEPVIALYVEADRSELGPWAGEPWEEGEPLAWLLDEEWEVFSDRTDSHDFRTDLLTAIADDVGLADTMYAPRARAWWHQNAGDYFERFARHMKRERRYIPKLGYASQPDDLPVPDVAARLRGLLSLSGRELTAGTKIWRAREVDAAIKQALDERRSPSEAAMGAPPPSLARAGRANPAGIAYFYGALDAGTAIAEIRPHLGTRVCVGEWSTTTTLRVIDLVLPRPIGAPWGRYDLDERIAEREFLSAVSRALSEPVGPSDEVIEYVPTQYVAEVVLDAGYDGIVYRSAQNDSGRNIVLWSQQRLALSKGLPSVHSVRGVSYALHPPVA